VNTSNSSSSSKAGSINSEGYVNLGSLQNMPSKRDTSSYKRYHYDYDDDYEDEDY
jgi:hypothetical protein